MKRAVVICIVVALTLIVGTLTAADLATRWWIEDQIEQQVRHNLPTARGVEVRLDGFPFVPTVVATGEVPGVQVSVESIHGGGLEAIDLQLDVEGLRLGRSALAQEHQLVIEGVERVTAEALIPTAQLCVVTGQDIEIEHGRVWREGDLGRTELRVDVRGSWIELYDGAHAPMVFPLPSLATMPCRPFAAPVDGGLRLRCMTEGLPGPLVLG